MVFYRHLFRVPDTDDVKQKNKNLKTMPNRFLPEHKAKRSLVLRDLCPVHDGLTVLSGASLGIKIHPPDPNSRHLLAFDCMNN